MAKNTKKHANYDPSYYKRNKEKVLQQQRERRAAKKKGIKIVRPKTQGQRKYEGQAPSRTKEAHAEYNKRWLEKVKEKEQAKATRRQQKADWARKKREEKSKALLEQYKKEFGYE